MPLLEIDIADTLVGRPSQPKHLLLHSDGRALVGIFDGSGSWGSGPDAASRVLTAVLARWQEHLLTLTVAKVVADLNEASLALPEDFREDEMGCSFSVVLALVEGRQLSVISTGLFNGLLLRSPEPTQHGKPRMLVDDLMERGQLQPEEMERSPHRYVCLGPFLGGPEPIEFTVTEDVMQAGEKLVLGHHQQVERLLADPPNATERQSLRATDVQAASPRPHPATLILLGYAHDS